MFHAIGYQKKKIKPNYEITCINQLFSYFLASICAQFQRSLPTATGSGVLFPCLLQAKQNTMQVFGEEG